MTQYSLNRLLENIADYTKREAICSQRSTAEAVLKNQFVTTQNTESDTLVKPIVCESMYKI